MAGLAVRVSLPVRSKRRPTIAFETVKRTVVVVEQVFLLLMAWRTERDVHEAATVRQSTCAPLVVLSTAVTGLPTIALVMTGECIANCTKSWLIRGAATQVALPLAEVAEGGVAACAAGAGERRVAKGAAHTASSRLLVVSRCRG